MHHMNHNDGRIIRPRIGPLVPATLLLATIFGHAGCDRPESEQAAAPPAPVLAPGFTPPLREAGTPTSRPTEQAREAPTDPRRAEFAGYSAPKPVKWQWQPPSETSRLTSYVVPGHARTGGTSAGQAHLFISRTARSEDAVIGEWAGRFRSPEGEPILPLIGTKQVDGFDSTLIEVSGDQIRPGTRWPTQDQMLFGLVLPQETGSILITLSGPRETVEANREAYMALIEGIERR